MATKDPGSDRKGARFDVSLPMRFTEDGENFSEGVVTSLSSIGLFVQTQRVPGLGSSVWFDLGLGGGLAPIRGRAKVGTLNRRFGTDVVTGFGIEFDSPREDINAALAALEGVYPGAVRLDTQGSLVWPIAPDPERPEPGHEGDGLRIGTPDGWVGSGGEIGNEAPAVAVGASLNRPIRDFLDMIRDLNGQILSCPAERIPFAYQGRLLGPSTGVYKSTIVAGLIALDREEEAERRRSAELAQAASAPEMVGDPPTLDVVATAVEGEAGEWTLDLDDLDVMPVSPVLEPAAAADAAPVETPGAPVGAEAAVAEPTRSGPAPIADPESARGRVLLDLLAAQMRMVDDLACGGWRLEHMWAEQLVSIEQGSALLAESIEHLAEISRATEATSGDETRELVTESLRGLDAVHSFLERVLWNARAFTPQEEVFRAYDDFVVDEKEAKSGLRPPKEKKKLFDATAAPTSTTSVRVERKAQPAKIAVAVVLLAAAGVAAYFSAQSSRKILDASKVHPPSSVSVQSIADAFEKANTEVRMAIDGITMEGAQARVTVPADWPYKPKPIRQREFETLVAVLADQGFTSAVVVTSEGIERASWNKGVVNVVD